MIVPDQPGYGQSDKPDFDGDYWAFAARCIADLLGTLGVDKAHFVGNSLGGGTTVRLALDHPDRIDGIILMGPAGVSVNVMTPHPSEGLKILSSFYDGCNTRTRLSRPHSPDLRRACARSGAARHRRWS